MSRFSRCRLGFSLFLLALGVLAGCSAPIVSVRVPTPADFSEPPKLLVLVSLQGVSRWPSWSPDGSEIVFGHGYMNWPADTLFRVSVPSGDMVTLLRREAGVSAPAWSPQGDLVALDLHDLSDPAGSEGIYIVRPRDDGPTRVTEEVGNPIWSPAGDRIAFTWDGIFVVRPDGTDKARLTTHSCSPSMYGASLSWSPDGKQIAFTSERDGNREVYVVSVDSSREANLTNHPDTDEAPAWSPDAEKIAFVSVRDGQEEVYLMNPDGSDQVNLTRTRREWESSPAWSPDGERIAFIASGSLYVMNADGSGRRLLVDPPGCECREYAWSPQGNWIAFSCVYSEPYHRDRVYASWIYRVRVNP